MHTLTTALLRHKAGAKSYWRGLTYRDSVTHLLMHNRHVAAKVMGTDHYDVELAWDGTQLVGECSCPHGEQGFFCKHCVAVGLVLLEQGRTLPPPDAEDEELREHLRSLDPDVLAELLYEHAGRDRALREKIMTAGSTSPG